MIPLGEEQQTATGFKIERLALRAERANHDRSRGDQSLLSRPESVFAFLGANDDELIKCKAVLGEP